MLLNDNQLQGPIPPALGSLVHLQIAQLAGNALTGCIPHSLRRLLTLPEFEPGVPANDFTAGDANGDEDSADEGATPGLGLPFCLLRDLHLQESSLDPLFAGGTAAYTATVPDDIEEILMTATVYDAGDMVTISKGGEAYTEGTALPLDPWPNAITVEVMPTHGTPPQIVTVTVTWEPAEPHAPSSVVLTLRLGGNFYIVSVGVSAMAADLFGGTDVTSVWTHTAQRGWVVHEPSTGVEDFPIEAGDVLWIVAPSAQPLPVVALIGSDAPPAGSGAISFTLREGSDLLAVPAGAPTTAAGLFGATDVTIAWKYNRATRTWDLSYLPALGCDGAIAPGDVLWIVKPIEQPAGCYCGA